MLKWCACATTDLENETGGVFVSVCLEKSLQYDSFDSANSRDFRRFIVVQCRSQRLARRFELERERRARRHSSARAPRPQPPHPSTNMSPVTTRTSPRLKTASEDGPAKVRRAHAAAPASSPVARSPSLPGFRAGRARATDRARRRDRRDARASRAVASFPRVRARRRAASACSAPYARRRARLAASRVSKRPPFVVARLL